MTQQSFWSDDVGSDEPRNLRSRDDYARRAWDWGFLNECFAPTKIRLADVDGVVERNGHFLFIEGKPFASSVTVGQGIMFDAMTRRGDDVLVLYGEPNVVKAAAVWPNDPTPCDAAWVKRYVRRWFEWAST